MSNTLTISKCGETDFQYWAIATSVGAVPNGRVLLGELHKIIPEYHDSIYSCLSAMMV